MRAAVGRSRMTSYLLSGRLEKTQVGRIGIGSRRPNLNFSYPRLRTTGGPSASACRRRAHARPPPKTASLLDQLLAMRVTGTADLPVRSPLRSRLLPGGTALTVSPGGVRSSPMTWDAEVPQAARCPSPRLPIPFLPLLSCLVVRRCTHHRAPDAPGDLSSPCAHAEPGSAHWSL